MTDDNNKIELKIMYFILFYNVNNVRLKAVRIALSIIYIYNDRKIDT